MLIQMRPNGLRTGITTPDTTCKNGHHKQSERRNNRKYRKKVKVLRQKRHAENIIVLRWHIKPNRLSAMKAQPWQY